MSNEQSTTNLAYSAIVSAADDFAKATAKRIATLARINPEQAAKDYQQHATALPANTRAVFDGYLSAFAAELEAESWA